MKYTSKNCKRCGGKMQTGGPVYTSQQQIDQANALAKRIAAKSGVDPYFVENSYVAKNIGDPQIRFDDPGSNVPMKRFPTSIPLDVKDIQSENGQYWYTDPHTGDLVDVDPSMANLPRFRRPMNAVASNPNIAPPLGTKQAGGLLQYGNSRFEGTNVNPSSTFNSFEQALNSAPVPKRTDPWLAFNTMRTGVVAANELAGISDRNRQDQYYYNQMSTVGQINPMHTNDFQPNPYNLYARLGGKLKHYQSGGSIVDFLNRGKKDSSFDAREQYYKQAGYNDEYRGSAEQNLTLLAKLSGHPNNNYEATGHGGAYVTRNTAPTAPSVSQASAAPVHAPIPTAPPVAARQPARPAAAATPAPAASNVENIFENDRQRYFAKKAAIANNGKFVLTDTNTHKTYYGTYDPKSDKFNATSFEVLTGEDNNDIRTNKYSNLPLDQIEKMPKNEQLKAKVTPVGFFPAVPNPNIYGNAGVDLQGSPSIAYHKTYEGADDMTRAARYNNGNNADNNISFGCINCQKPSVDALYNFVKQNPVKALVINSGKFYKENADAIRANSPQTAKSLNLTFRMGGLKYGKGGNIHIDPSKKGTFKAQASKMGMGVQEAASSIMAHPDNYSAAMRKKANFARNFAR